jgi:PAS domain S-box-containing protein
MVESSYVTVIHVDGTGIVRWISPSLELMLGWRPAEWLGQQVSGYVVPEDIDRLTANIGIILTTAQPLTERYRAIAKDGSIH